MCTSVCVCVRARALSRSVSDSVTPWTMAHQDPLSARILEQVAIPFSSMICLEIMSCHYSKASSICPFHSEKSYSSSEVKSHQHIATPSC